MSGGLMVSKPPDTSGSPRIFCWALVKFFLCFVLWCCFSLSTCYFSGEWWIGKGGSLSGYGLIEVLSWHLLGGTEKYHQMPWLGWPLSCLRYEPGIFEVQVFLPHHSVCYLVQMNLVKKEWLIKSIWSSIFFKVERIMAARYYSWSIVHSEMLLIVASLQCQLKRDTLQVWRLDNSADTLQPL